MPKTIRYIGTQNYWPEVAYTGRPTRWMPGMADECPDNVANALLATGLFRGVLQSVYLDSVTRQAVDAAGNAIGGGAPIVISGVPAVGNTLTATISPGWRNSGGNWTRDGANISGATALTYPLVSADNDKDVTYASSNIPYTPPALRIGAAAPVAPGAPTIGTATAGDGVVNVVFTAPASTGGSPILEFQAELSNTNSATGAGSPIPVPSPNGAAVTSRVRARNAVDWGPWSANSNSVTPNAGATVPGQPAAPTATAGDGTATYAFAAPASNGGSPILEYRVTQSTGEQVFGASSPITAVGQTNGQARTGTVAARNAVGWGPESAASNSVTPSAGTPTVTADYIVYGANAGGLWGAMKAADLGLSVAVINEHTANRLGGMLMGIMHTDIQSTPPLRGKGFARGLVDELYRRVAASFPTPLSQEAFLTQSLYGMRPEYVWAVMNDMLASRGITVYHNEQLVSVAKTGTAITELTTTGRKYVAATNGTFVDATYHGDLLDKAGVATFVGRESSAQYGETSAGIRPLSSSIHASVSPYVIPGDDTSGLLPGISSEPLGTPGDASPLVQVCTIRLYHRADLGQSPMPPDYDPLNYELLRRNIIAKGLTQLNTVFDLYDLQDANTWDVNNGPQTGGSLNYTGPECTEYVTATHARRLEIEQKIKNYILGLLYFLRTDTTISSNLRTQAGTLRVMNVPLFGGDGFPPNFYLRQGRTMIGTYVLKEADVTTSTTTHLPNRIAKVIYPGDRHWSRRVVVNPGPSANVQTEGGMALPVVYGNAIPRTVLLPQAAHCSNVMPTFCISASAIAQGSIRMEVLSMMFGVATAAIAKARKTAAKTVQAVTQAEIEPLIDYWNLYDTNGGAIVAVPNNTVPAGVATGTIESEGTWTTPSGAEQVAVAYGGAVGQPGAKKRFFPNLAATGVYEVRLCWNSQSDVARNTATIVRVVHAGGTFSTTKNQNTQTSAADTGDWGLVGGDLNPRSASQFTFNAGSPSAHYVEVEVPASGGTGVIAAVKFIRLS